MSTRRARPPPPSPLLDHKAWFLGRFVSETFDERARARLRANIRLTKGSRTRLRLTACGLSDGSRSCGIGPFRDRSKIVDPNNFSPMRDIRWIGQDAVYNNVLLCVSDYGVSQCEILAYRLRSDTAVTAFQDAFAALSAKANNSISNSGSADGPTTGSVVGETSSVHSIPPRQRNWFLLPDESRLCTLRSVPEHVSVSYPYRYRNRAVSAERTADPAAVKEENDKPHGGLADHLVSDHVARARRRPSRETTPRVSFEATDVIGDVSLDAACQTNGCAMTLATSDSLRRTMRSLSDHVQDIRAMLLKGKEHGNVGFAAKVLVNGGKVHSDSFTSLTSLQKAIIRASISNVAGTVKIVVDDYRMRRRELSRSHSPRPQSERSFSDYDSSFVSSGHAWHDRVSSARGESDVSSTRRRSRRRSAHDVERIAHACDDKRRSRSLEHHKQSPEVVAARACCRHDVFTLHPTYALQTGDSTFRLVRSPTCDAIPWYKH